MHNALTDHSLTIDDLGYCIYHQVLSPDYLSQLERVVRQFHHWWLTEYRNHFLQGAINSAYLTRNDGLSHEDRVTLFRCLCHEELLHWVTKHIPSPAFLNTQLFFDPHNPDKANYWHRDIQYGFDDQTQQALLAQSDLIPHFRIPLVDESGLELIPGSHKRWDTPEEYAVRQELEGRTSHDALQGGQVISLQRGDILVFSAKMLHRGIYGNDRFAFDVLFAPEHNDYVNEVRRHCLPDDTMPADILRAPVFSRTLAQLSDQ